MVAGLLNTLGGDTSLVAKFREAIFKLLTTVKLLTNFVEVVLNHIDVLLVDFGLDSWVFYDQDAEFVKGCGNFETFILPLSTLLKVGLNVDHRRLAKFLGQLVDSVSRDSCWSLLHF